MQVSESIANVNLTFFITVKYKLVSVKRTQMCVVEEFVIIVIKLGLDLLLAKVVSQVEHMPVNQGVNVVHKY